MEAPLMNPMLWIAIGVAVVAVGTAAVFLLRGGEQKGDLQRMVTLLRASDPATRIQALERARALPPSRRAALARRLRGELSATAKGGKQGEQQALTVWFIRQVLALLADARPPVRMDAARVLGAVMGGTAARLSEEGDGELSAGVMAAVELAGGRVLSQSEEEQSETRVLAVAEMVEAGLSPLATGLRALQGQVQEEALEPLSSALRDRSPSVRRSLVEVLAAMGGDKAVEMLTPLLQDPAPDLRAQAARALGNLRAESAVGQLVDLLNDPIGGVRAAAAGALAAMERRESCAKVLAALSAEAARNDGDGRTRAAMIEAVVELWEGADGELARSLTALPRPVARSLAGALEERGVVERWLTEGFWRGKEEALTGLLASVADLGVTRPLLEALDSTDEWARMRAAAALGHSRDAASLTAVSGLLSDPDGTVRAEAVRSLSRRPEAPALLPLARAAADPDTQVRLEAVRGITRVLEGRGVWRTEAVSEDFDVQSAVAEAEQALLHVARTEGGEARERAAEGLGLMGSAEAAEVLAELSLSDEEVADAASEAFARCGFAQKMRLLAGALEAADERRRARAVRILGALGGAESGRQVVEALGDPSAEVRSEAVRALGSADVPGGSLTRYLKSDDARVRAAVAAQIGKQRAAEAVEALVQVLGDPEEDVRVAALEALSGMGRTVRRHQGAVSARRSDPSPKVREAAAAALSRLRGAWSEAAEVGGLFRQGPLSEAGAAALVDMAATGDTEPLLRALGAPQANRAIAGHLAGAGRGQLGAVLGALHGLSEPEQTRAAISLAQGVDNGPTAEPFLAALKALDGDVRLMAVEIAGQIRTPEAVSAVIEVLQRDPVADVRSRAASLLGSAPGPRGEVRRALERAQRDDPSNVVRRVAGRALEREGQETQQLTEVERSEPPAQAAEGGQTAAG